VLVPLTGNGGSSPPSDTNCGAITPNTDAIEVHSNGPGVANVRATGTSNLNVVSPTSGLVRAKVTERLVASLVPVRTAHAAAPPVSPAWSQFEPLPQLSSVLLHSVAPMDASSRLYEARLFAALGWHAGRHLTAAAHPRGLLLATAAADTASVANTAVIDGRGRLKLPLSLRRRLGVTPGECVWLAADVASGWVLVTSCLALDNLAQAMTTTQLSPRGGLAAVRQSA
jgi:hypothetical protein